MLWSDGGPQFTSKQFNDFVQRWGFTHITSSPRNPQNNRKAESDVKSIKKLIQASWTGRSLDHEKFCRALLQYHNTPSRKDGLSPAQKLFAHLACSPSGLPPRMAVSVATAEQQRHDNLESSAAFYNQHTHPLKDITVGSHVAIQNPQTKAWEIYGIVTEINPQRRYYIKTKGGRVLVRNRRFLRQRLPTSIPETTLPSSQALPPTPEPTPLRRSSRTIHPTRRLIEDPD